MWCGFVSLCIWLVRIIHFSSSHRFVLYLFSKYSIFFAILCVSFFLSYVEFALYVRLCVCALIQLASIAVFFIFDTTSLNWYISVSLSITRNMLTHVHRRTNTIFLCVKRQRRNWKQKSPTTLSNIQFVIVFHTLNFIKTRSNIWTSRCHLKPNSRLRRKLPSYVPITFKIKTNYYILVGQEE